MEIGEDGYTLRCRTALEEVKVIIQNIAIGSGNSLLTLKTPSFSFGNLRLETCGPPVSVLYITCAVALKVLRHGLSCYFCCGCA